MKKINNDLIIKRMALEKARDNKVITETEYFNYLGKIELKIANLFLFWLLFIPAKISTKRDVSLYFPVVLKPD